MDAISKSGPYFRAPLLGKAEATFDRQTEHFLSNAPTQPELEPIPLEILLADPRTPRRELQAWVFAAVAVCLAILAIAVLTPP